MLVGVQHSLMIETLIIDDLLLNGAHHRQHLGIAVVIVVRCKRTNHLINSLDVDLPPMLRLILLDAVHSR